MSTEYRVQLENENGSVLYVLFQTPDSSRANDFSEDVKALNDKFSTDHNVQVREYQYEYRVGSDDGEWVLVSAISECKTEHNYMDYRAPVRYSL